MGKLVQFDKYIKPEDLLGMPCTDDGCPCHYEKEEKSGGTIQ